MYSPLPAGFDVNYSTLIKGYNDCPKHRVSRQYVRQAIGPESYGPTESKAAT